MLMVKALAYMDVIWREEQLTPVAAYNVSENIR